VSPAATTVAFPRDPEARTVIRIDNENTAWSGSKLVRNQAEYLRPDAGNLRYNRTYGSYSDGHAMNRSIRGRYIFCALYLILFVLSEAYSAAATALDHSGRFPAWEAQLGWGLFVLPCLLLFGLILLLSSKLKRLGLYLIGLSLVVYAEFLLLEDFLARKQVVRMDWIFNGMWLTLCALAIGAGWLLKHRPVRN
jgi:hypothetical protein